MAFTIPRSATEKKISIAKQSYNKKYYQKNKERISEQHKKYLVDYMKRLGVKERIKKRMQEYNQRPEVKKRETEQKRIYEQIPEVKERRKKQHKEWSQKNKERIKEVAKKYRQIPKNKLRKKQNGKLHYEKNKEEINKKKRAYAKKPKVKERKQKRMQIYMKRPEIKKRTEKRRKEYIQRPEVKERERAIYNKRYSEDIPFKIQKNLRRLFLKSFKCYSKGIGKQYSSKKYGVNFTAIIKHLKPFPEPVCEYHIDHIIPLSKFDFNNPEHIKMAFAPENHQWLTIKQNLEKGGRLIMPH